jgi:tetrahydromethanopterin S-methyltransferase subunit B
LIFIAFALPVISQQQQPTPYTMADRDRLIQVEAQVSSLNQRFDDMNKRFDDMNNRFDDMNNRLDRLEDKFDTYFTWGFGLVLGAIFALMGFVIWDRRTTLSPVVQQQERILLALKEMSKDNSTIREALKKAALY